MTADLKTALGLRLYRYPYWGPEFQAVYDRLLPGDVFVDGGANVGLFTLLAASRVGPSGRVIAVEPGPVCDHLQRNVELNGYRHVEVERVALGRECGTRAFTVFDGDGAGLSSFSPAQSGGKATEVAVKRLDDVVPAHCLERLRMVKLDLEGAEVEALGGATALLKDSQADFLVEVEPEHLKRQGATVEQLLSFFDGFRAARFPGTPNVLFARR